MKARVSEWEETPELGKTPEGQVVAETPETSIPAVFRYHWGAYGEWLGDPGRRYGRLMSSRRLPDWVKLEMMCDPIFSWCQAWIKATLLRMERVITCPDETKRRFFQTLWDAWGREYLQQASMAISIGHLGMVKRFAFRAPRPEDGPPVWTFSAKPFIIVGFDQVYPVGSSARFDDTRRHFEGITMSDGTEVDRIYSLWITMGQEEVFGDYNGRGRLTAGYPAWWLQRFNRDMFTVARIKSGDPVVVSRYPPGQTPGGKSHRDIARDVGDAVRSGATVALSSQPYEAMGLTGERTYTNVRRWDVDFIGEPPSVVDLVTFEDHLDAEKALAYFLAHQMFKQVKQSALGGPTTADVLAQTAEETLLADAATLDRHLNDYCFEPMSTWNFPPGSPAVRIETIGLDRTSKEHLLEIMKVLLSKPEAGESGVNVREGLRRLGIPVEVEIEQAATAYEQFIRSLQAQGPNRIGGQGEDDLPAQVDGVDVPLDVLRAMIEERIDPVPAEDVISESDINRAMRMLRRNFPELFPDRGE